MKILNLYSGIGGNRRLWGNDHEIVAIENNEAIAQIYRDFFPKDKVVVTDAHKYLLENYEGFDFVWSSPPCPSHSRFRFMTTKMTDEEHKRPVIYPDMRLYQEIILLRHYFKGKYCVENVQGYYDPLIEPQRGGRHYFWANFIIHEIKMKPLDIKGSPQKLGELDISDYKDIRKDQVIRNCVEPELGLHIFEEAFRELKTLL